MKQPADKVTYVFEETVFEPFRSQIDIPVPLANRDLIVDAYIAIQTRLDVRPRHVDSIGPEAPNDLRLYLNSVDVTPYYLTELREVLNKVDQIELLSGYEKGMSSFISYADAMGPGYDGSIANLKSTAAKLRAIKPLSSLLARLGDETHGHKGHLHLANFLYGQIPAPAVSLASVIGAFNDKNPKAKLSILQLHTLSVSCGPSYSRDSEAWNKDRPRPRGAAAISLSVKFHDPLEDELAQLRKEFEDLKVEITESLQNIQDALSPAGPIRRTIAQIESTSNSSFREVEATHRDVNSCSAIVTAQEPILRQIQAQVDAL